MLRGGAACLVAFVLAWAAATAAVGTAPAEGEEGGSGLGDGDRRVDTDRAGSEYAAGELLVTFERGSSESAREAASNAVEARAAGDLSPDMPEAPDTRLLEFPDIKAIKPGSSGVSAREGALARRKAELAQTDGVVAVDYNYVRARDFSPDDGRFGAQWGLRKSEFPAAWDRSRGLYLKVGVIDSGISSSHPDVRGKVADERDFAEGDVRAEDNVGHGTLVSGAIAAATDNGVGVAGACFRCRLLVAKDGDGAPVDAWSIKGIYWAVRSGAKAINISSGDYAPSGAYERAVEYAVSHGAVVAASAGNDASDSPRYPAAYPAAVSVVATNRDDRRASFSNYGPTVDLAAPGVGVLSTARRGGYSYVSGTSLASPHVAALAGLVRHRGLSVPEARNRIENTAQDLGAGGNDPLYGHGRIRAAAAVP